MFGKGTLPEEKWNKMSQSARRDSNPQAHTGTSPSSWRVYRFRHARPKNPPQEKVRSEQRDSNPPRLLGKAACSATNAMLAALEPRRVR